MAEGIFAIQKRRLDRPYFPNLTTKEVGWYSTDADLNFDITTKKLKYFNPHNFDYSRVEFDLNTGLDEVSLYETNLNLDYILKWIDNHRKRYQLLFISCILFKLYRR